MTEWTQGQDAYACMAALQAASVPAGVCQTAEDNARNLGELLGYSSAQVDTSRNPDVSGRDGRAAVVGGLRGGITEITLLMDAVWGGMVVRPAVSDPTSSFGPEPGN